MLFLNIAKSFKNARVSRNVSQEDLASKINVSRQMITQIESGTRLPSLNIAIETANVFKCSLDELVGRNIRKEV